MAQPDPQDSPDARSDPPRPEGRRPIWVVVADHARARLLRATQTPHGRTHLEQHDELLERWDEREGHREGPPHTIASHPSAGGAGPLTSMRGGGTDWSGVEAERRRRFALQIWDWLQKHLDTAGMIGPGDADRPLVFSPPALLGEFRKHARDSALESVEFHQADLARLPQSRLLEERALTKALASRWG